MARRKPTPSKKKFSNRPLAGLSKLPLAPPETRHSKKDPAPQKRLEEDDDGRLFAEAVAGAKPLEGHSNRLPPAPKPGIRIAKSVERQETEEVMEALRDLVDGQSAFSIHHTDEAIEGAVEGLDAGIVSRLRAGEYSVQDHLDLHGLTRDQARETVELFIRRARLQGKRCVLIIHGRGLGSANRMPVLKNALVAWFTRRAMRKNILAFTTARNCDGGAGAVYVLLRKNKPRRA